MKTTTIVIALVVLLVVTFALGYWLRVEGRPHGMLLLTVHKLVALGALGLIGWFVYHQQGTGLPVTTLVAVVVGAVVFVATIVTGGLVSLEQPPVEWVAVAHRVLPYVTAVASAGVVWLVRG